MKLKWNLLVCVLLLAVLLSASAWADDPQPLPAPQFSVTGTTYARGELMPATLSEVAGADYYRVEAVASGSTESIYMGRFISAGSIWLSTARLEAGSYTLKAFAMIETGEVSEDGQPLDIKGQPGETSVTVTPYAETAPIIIRMSQTQTAPAEWTRVSIYAPGALFVELITPDDPELDWGANGDYWDYNITMTPGSHRIGAEAYFADGSVVMSDEVTLQVVEPASVGTLGEPVMELADPTVATAGQDLTVTYSFGPEDNTAGIQVAYGWTLTNVFSGRVVSQNENLSPAGGTFVVDGSLLEESQEYILELYTKTEAEGYLDKAQDVQLLMVPAAGSAELSLTCNGQTEIEIPNHTNIRLNIHAPGATGLRFYTGKGDEWYPYEVWERLLNDVQWNWEHWTEGNFALYVKACYDDDPYDEAAEWIASAPVLIHVTVTEGRLSKPQFVLPQQVTIGEILEIDNITLDQGAEWCWAELYPVGDNGRVDWEEQLAFCDILNGSIYFPTDRLLPGHSYMISMTCSGPGYLDSRSAYQAFTAVGQAPSDPTYFHIINPNVVTNEYVTAMGYVPGASHIRVYIDGDPHNTWIMEDDDSFSTSWWRFDESGDHTVTLSALYAEEWESWSEWVDIAERTIHVTAPNGELNMYGWMAPNWWTEGDDWSLTFEATQADTIWFDMWKERDDRWHWTYDSEEILNLTVPGSILTEGVYHYHVHLTKRGYEGKTINGTLVVTGNVLDANLTLSVTPGQVECGEEFTLQASAPGATAIGIWIPEYNDYLEAVDSLTVTDSIGWEGEFVVFARACYDPLPDDPDLYGEDMNWGSFSQVQTLTVSAPYGAAGLPNVSGLSAGDLIPWGNDVSLTVSGGTGAASYDLHVYHEEDGGEDRLNAYIEEDEFGSGGSCTMSTYDMDPGPYVLEIYVHGLQGYSANSMRIPFTVQGEGQCGRITPSLLANSVERGDFLQIDLPYAEDAVWYDVHVRDENWNEYAYARYPKNGSYDIPTAELTEGTYLVMVSTGAPGYTWNETRFQDAPRFTVTEPAGEVLNFSVSRTQVAPSENFLVSVYAPGADQIILLENGRNAGSRDSDAYAELRWWGKAGTYAYQALVHYPADGSLEERWESTSTIHVQVGHAGTEPIDIAQLAFTMPDRIQPGDDLLLSWQNIGLYHYDLNIWDDQEGRQVWHCWNHHGETSVLVPAVMPDHCPSNAEDMFAPGESIFEEGRIYQVNIEFSQIGYESVRFNRQLLVLPNSTQAMSLTVNGSQTEVTVPVHTNAQVLLDAPAGATAALAFNGYGWEWNELDEEGDTELEWSWWDTTRRFLFARYTTDAVDGRSWEDYAWSDPSNLVTVQPTITGNAPAPEVTMPSSVMVGTDVTFTVSNTSDFNGYMWDVYSPVEEWEWEWQDWNGLSEQTFSTRNLRIGQTYVLNVQSHGGPGLEETAVQRLFTVTGQGVMPDAHGLLPATVERGAMLELTLTNLEQLRGYEGLWLSAAPYDPLEDRWFGGKYGWEGGNTICIPTSNLEVRSEPYTLYLDCGAVGWENSCSEFGFEVTEPSGPVMSLGRATVETMEDIPFSFYVPGASEITVTINEEEGWTWDSVWIMDSWGGEYAEGDWLNFDQTGTYQLRLYARYGSGDWEYTGQSTSVQVTGERLDLVIDSVLQSGEDFLIPLPEGITRVDAEIYDDTEDGMNIFWKHWEAGRRGDYNQFDYRTQEWVAPDGGDCLHSTSGEIRIPSGYLQTNHTYRIDLHMSGQGYERKDVYGQQFSVVNGTDARVTMTVTLQDSSRNPLVNEQFQVRAYAENAAAIRVFDGWNWHYRTGDTLTETWIGGAPGTYFLYAQAYYGDAPWAEDGFDWGSWDWNNCGLAWGGISNVVELTFEGFGECERVYAQLAQTAVVRGEFLSFTIPEADHAEWYDVHVRNDHGSYYDARYSAPGTYAIPTARLEADDEYVVLISTSASGYQGSESFYEQAPRFIVYDPEDGQIRFRVSKTVVETSEDFVISVWAPGADAIRILEGTRQMDARWNTDSYNEWHALLYAGTYELQAMVHYPDMAGERARWVSSDPVIMTAGNPNTPELDLNALAFTMPDAIGPGQDLTLSWQDIGLYHYDVNIYRERDGHRVWHSWNDHGETSLTVPRVMPDTLPNSVDWFEAPGTVLLEEGEIYHVQIHFNKIGYNAADLSRQFAVLETNSQTGISLTVGGSQTALSIPVNTSVTVQIHAPDGATAALVWGGYDWQWYELDEHGDAEFEWSWGDLNQRILYARYTTEPVGSYGNWEDYSWNGPSNLVTVHPTSTGKTAAPDVTMASTVLTGTEVTFTVNNAASFNGFHWTIQDLADDWEWSWEDWHGESTQTFSTRGFVIGRTYYLKVDSHGTEGLLPNQTVIPFVVEGSGILPEAQASVPASVTRGDVLEITILNGGTMSQAQGLTVQAAPYDALYDRWFGSWYDWDGEDTILIPTANLEARSEPYMLYVECTADGWETSHSEYAFTVTESAQANLHFARTSAETQENIVYTLYVPGATSTMITVDEQPGWTMDNTWIQGPWDRNYAEETIRFDQNGSHEVRLYGQYGTDEWVYTGQSVTVQVTGADLDLESLLPDTLLIGQNFQPDLPEGMTQVAINVYDDTMQGLEIYWMNWDEGRRSDYNYFDTDSMTWAVPNDGEPMHGNDGSVLIPADYLKENHTYIIDLRLAVRGYNTVHLQYVSFVVISGTDSRVSFSVTYPDPTRNLLIQEHLEILAHAEGASVIRFYDGRGWYYNTGDTYQGFWSTTEPGTRTMFAQAYFGEVPWTEQNINPYTFDWDAYDLAWCGISNMVEVTVESLGQAGSFDFVDHSTVNAKQGEVVAIAFTEAANASTYYLQVYNQDNYIQWSTWSDEETVYLRTVNIPEGTYTLRGRVRGTAGYEMNDSTGTVTLIVQSAETLGTPTMRTPGALTEIEEEAFEGTAAEVVEIGFGVTDIGARAFADSQLEQIILPSSVGSIGAGALDSGVAVFGEFDSYAMYWALSNGFRFYEMQ